MNNDNQLRKRMEMLLPVILDKDDFHTDGLIAACAAGFDMINAYLDEVYTECFIDTANDYGLEMMVDLFDIDKTCLPEEKRNLIMEYFCKSSQVMHLDEINNDLLKLDSECYFTSDHYSIVIRKLPANPQLRILKLGGLGKIINKYVPPGVKVKVVIEKSVTSFGSLDNADYTFRALDSYDCMFSIYDTI